MGLEFLVMGDKTTKEVAEILNVSPITVRLWCRQGKFPNAREEQTPRGAVWWIPDTDLKDFKKPSTGRPKKK